MIVALDQSPCSDVLPIKPRRAVLIAWALMATLNLSAGIVIASWPERQWDLDSMRRWGRQFVAGSNTYITGQDFPGYPPYAIVALSPLGTLPARWAVPVWAALNLSMALAAPYLAVRAVSPAATLSTAILPILMFLCWGGFRTLLQFSLLALTLGLAAIVLADRRPRWSGICLGLALMKPQMSAPFLFWALFTRRLRVAGVAVAVVSVGFALYCLRVQSNPVSLVQRYLDILYTMFGSEAGIGLIGLTEFRPLIALVVANPVVVDSLGAAISLSLLTAICIHGFAEGTRTSALMFSAPPLAGIWSLLTFYHLTYGFILLLPTATALLFTNDPQTVTLRRKVFWALQLGLMVDIPGLSRRFRPMLGVPAAVDVFMLHADRALLVALFACMCMLSAKIGREGVQFRN